MKTKLQIAWISGIVYVIMGFPEMILDLTRGGEAYSGPFLGLYSLVYAFSIAAGILFILGFLLHIKYSILCWSSVSIF